MSDENPTAVELDRQTMAARSEMSAFRTAAAEAYKLYESMTAQADHAEAVMHNRRQRADAVREMELRALRGET